MIDAAKVPGVLAVMATAGLYDDSGKWLYHTGLPAKSGVGGGIIAVSPGKFGIAVISPPLDDAGNSIRAQRAIADISNALGGNPLRAQVNHVSCLADTLPHERTDCRMSGVKHQRTSIIGSVLCMLLRCACTWQCSVHRRWPWPGLRRSQLRGVQGTAQTPVTIRCESTSTTRIQCDADTSAGVVLASSFGGAAVPAREGPGATTTRASGCRTAAAANSSRARRRGVQQTTKTPEYVPNAGFLLYDGEKGQIYFRLFSYVRYLNQRNIDASYTDAFGVPHTVQQRQDIQLAKFFAPFSGWFLTPKFRYYLYVWSSNASQGDPAQVVGGGNLSYVFNRFVTVGGGITSLPTVRSTEGQFPYWLGVDGRLIADEFFRGSYTNGVWVKGDLFQKLKYNAMFATNLSILGVSASQIDNKMDTQSFALQWLPTTGEFGLFGTFGDYDYHEKVATRVAVHWSHSLEDKQSQPGTNGIENSQIRLTDGSIVFTPDLFGQGITVNNVDYQMTSVDGGRQIQGAVARGRVLLAHAVELHRRQHRRHSRHQRHRLPAAVVGDGDQGRPAGLLERIADLRRLRRPVRGARRRELVLQEAARAPAQRRVHQRESQPGRLHGLSDAGRRQRQHLPHQPRDELLRLIITWHRSDPTARAI